MKHADLGADRLEVDAELRQMALGQGRKTQIACYDQSNFVKASQKKSCASIAQSVDMESFEIVKEARAWVREAW